jgi:hypothetical protein
LSLLELYLAKPHPFVTGPLRVRILALFSCAFFANGLHMFSAFGTKDPAGWMTAGMGMMVLFGTWWGEKERNAATATGVEGEEKIRRS